MPSDRSILFSPFPWSPASTPPWAERKDGPICHLSKDCLSQIQLNIWHGISTRGMPSTQMDDLHPHPQFSAHWDPTQPVSSPGCSKLWQASQTVLLVLCNSTLKPLGVSFPPASRPPKNGAETDGGDALSPHSREGYQNEDEGTPGPACHRRFLPRASSSSFSSPPRPQLQTSSYIGGNNLPSVVGSRERRWACKHLKLEPAGQPTFPPPSSAEALEL